MIRIQSICQTPICALERRAHVGAGIRQKPRLGDPQQRLPDIGTGVRTTRFRLRKEQCVAGEALGICGGAFDQRYPRGDE